MLDLFVLVDKSCFSREAGAWLALLFNINKKKEPN